MKSTDFDQNELEFIDKQTLPSLQILKQDLKLEQSAFAPVGTSPSAPAPAAEKSFLGGIISAVTGK